MPQDTQGAERRKLSWNDIAGIAAVNASALALFMLAAPIALPLLWRTYGRERVLAEIAGALAAYHGDAADAWADAEKRGSR